MERTEEVEKLASLCKNMGADSAQAYIMARQLSKRADQISDERNISRMDAMDYLLQLMISGRQGEVPDSFESKNSEKTDTE